MDRISVFLGERLSVPIDWLGLTQDMIRLEAADGQTMGFLMLQPTDNGFRIDARPWGSTEVITRISHYSERNPDPMTDCIILMRHAVFGHFGWDLQMCGRPD